MYINMAPPLSPGYVSRTELERQILYALSEPVRGNSSTCVGLWGAAGIGKTSLASAVAHNPAIQTIFSGGVFWGRVPRSLEHVLSEWVRALRGEPANVSTQHEGINLFWKEIELRGKPPLIILDEVTDVQAATTVLNVFQRHRSSLPSAILVIARAPDVLEVLDTDTNFQVSTLSVDEALSVLVRSGFDKDDLDRNRGDALELIQLLDQHPLALRLVAANAKARGVNLEDVLVQLRTFDLQEFTISGTLPIASLSDVLSASYAEIVKTGGQELATRLVELGVFAPTAPFSKHALKAVWQDETDATIDEYLDILISRSFCEKIDNTLLRIHPTVHKFIRRQLLEARPYMAEEVFLRHAVFYRQVAQSTDKQRIAQAIPNIAVALDWTLSRLTAPHDLPSALVFLSHASVDDDVALDVAEKLERSGARVWIDNKSIPEGERWDRVVWKALQEAQVMVLLISPSAMRSENVMDEVNYWLDERKLIIPILIQKTEIYFRLRRFQYINYQENPENGIRRLVQALRRHLTG